MRPAAPMSWMPTMRVGLHHLEARLEQQLLREGVADLHGGTLLRPTSRRTPPTPRWRRGCRRGRCARRRRSRGLPTPAPALEDAVGVRDAEGERVDQDVAVVAPRRRRSRRRRSARRCSCRSRRCRRRRRDQDTRVRGSSSAPKRSESSSAIGRAPMVKMSRRMPPTPVAAPWYGSMNEGWLWISILKTAASPSPMSTAPAFSPGPCSTRGPGRRQRLAGGRASSCRSSAPTTSPRRCRAPAGRLAAEQLLDALVLVRR